MSSKYQSDSLYGDPRQMHRMTPKWPWTLKDQRYPIHILQRHVPTTLNFHSVPLLRWTPNFHSVALLGWPFSSYMPFWDKCTEIMTLNTKRSKVHHIQLFISTLELKISVCFTLRWSVFELQAILRQVHWMTPKWPWTIKGQRYPYIYYNYPELPNFTPFCSTGSRFCFTCHLRQVH